MAGYTKQSDGYYHIPIVQLGERLQNNFGLRIREHEHFDPVDDVHVPGSLHETGRAIDIQDWRGGSGHGSEGFSGVGYLERTKNLESLLSGSGSEIIGPTRDSSGHPTHLHLGSEDGIFRLTDNQYQYLFGGQSGGKLSTFSHSFTPPDRGQTPDVATDTPAPVKAKEKAQAYKDMSKQQLDSQYDQLRSSDPAKARVEGMKMHKAYFGK